MAAGFQQKQRGTGRNGTWKMVWRLHNTKGGLPILFPNPCFCGLSCWHYWVGHGKYHLQEWHNHRKVCSMPNETVYWILCDGAIKLNCDTDLGHKNLVKQQWLPLNEYQLSPRQECYWSGIKQDLKWLKQTSTTADTHYLYHTDLHPAHGSQRARLQTSRNCECTMF